MTKDNDRSNRFQWSKDDITIIPAAEAGTSSNKSAEKDGVTSNPSPENADRGNRFCWNPSDIEICDASGKPKKI